MRTLYLGIIAALLLMVNGCSQADETAIHQDEVSPIFISENIELQGTKGRIAILSPGFVAGQTNKYMWHFWGTTEDLSGARDFKVKAVNVETGAEVDVLIINNTTLAGPNNGADAHLPSNMMIPDAGIWRLEAYFDERLYGTITVEVK